MPNINTRKLLNKTTINRSKLSKTYYKKSMPMLIYKDKDLNFIDIGLLTWLLSNSKNFIVNKNYVMKRSGLPEQKFLDSWKKLKQMGYIEKRLFQGGVEWIINETSASYRSDNK